MVLLPFEDRLELLAEISRVLRQYQHNLLVDVQSYESGVRLLSKPISPQLLAQIFPCLRDSDMGLRK